MARKAWNDDAEKLVTIPSSGVDPLAAVDPSERRPDALSVACRECNAKPGENCGALVAPFEYRKVPHFSRGRS